MTAELRSDRSDSGGLASPFARNVATLSGGTLVSRVIAVASLPVLTRLFTPGDFGVLAVYVAFVTFGIAIGTLTYDWAIPLPAEEEKSAALLVVSIFVALATAGVGLVLFWLFGDWLVRRTATVGLDHVIMLVPFAALLTSVTRAFHFWNVKRKAFRRTAVARVAQTMATVGSQIGGGLLGMGGAGLVAGDCIGRFAGALVMAVRVLRQDAAWLRGVVRERVRGVAREYRRFPLVSSWSSVVTALGLQLPVVVLAATFGPQVAGWMGLGQRLVALPTEFVGRAVADVFLGEAAELMHRSPRRLRERFWEITRKASLAVFPFGLGAALAPWLFGWIFGPEWVPAGVFVAWLGAPYFAQFVVISTSNLPAYGRNGWQLVWEICRLLLSVAAILAGHLLAWSATATIALLAMLWTGLYAVLFRLNVLAIRGLLRGAPPVEAV